MSTPDETIVDPVEEPTNLPWSNDLIALRDEVILPSFAHDLYEELAPAAVRDAGSGDGLGWPLAHWCKAVGGMIQDIVSLSDAPSSWSDLVSVDKCPPEALGWLGQFSGTRLPQQITADEARAYLHDQPNMRRGTVEGITKAIQSKLENTKYVNITERADGNPYKIIINTWISDTPDEAAIQAMIDDDGPNAIIPAGIIAEYEVIPPYTTFGMLRESGMTFADVESTYTDFEDVWMSPPP